MTRQITSAMILAVSVLLNACTAMLFQPLKPHIQTPEIVDLEYDDITIASSDGTRLHGWKLLAKGERKGAVLFLHGNGENISTHFGNLYWLMFHGYDGYIFDYRGYGKSDGVAELDGVIRDASSMLDYVIQQSPQGEHIIVIGHSLGGALAIQAVAAHPEKSRLTALVTVEAFSDYRAVTRDVLSTSWLTWLLQWPVSMLIDNDYRPLDVVSEISPLPLLIVHSRRDRLVPFYHALELYEAAREPKRLVEINSDHSHVFTTKENRRLLLDALDAVKKAPGKPGQ